LIPEISSPGANPSPDIWPKVAVCFSVCVSARLPVTHKYSRSTRVAGTRREQLIHMNERPTDNVTTPREAMAYG